MALFSISTILHEPPDSPPPRKPRPKRAVTPHPASPASGAADPHQQTQHRQLQQRQLQQRQLQQRLATQRQTSRSTERETRHASGDNSAAATADAAQSGRLLPGFGGHGQGSGHGGGGSESERVAGSGSGADGELDCDALLDLLPLDGDSGIFELLLPDGEQLAVVVDVSGRLASFLLKPTSDKLRQLLQRRKMELESGVAQRMGRHVRLTVL